MATSAAGHDEYSNGGNDLRYRCSKLVEGKPHTYVVKTNVKRSNSMQLSD